MGLLAPLVHVCSYKVEKERLDELVEHFRRVDRNLHRARDEDRKHEEKRARARAKEKAVRRLLQLGVCVLLVAVVGTVGRWCLY